MDDHLPGLDLRTARVISAREHPDADRLLVLDIDLGEAGTRQIVAGLVGHYEPAELIGRSVVVVVNLEPADLRGERSEGMLLAGRSGERLGLLLAPAAQPGTRLTTEEAVEPAPRVTIDEFREHEIVAEEGDVLLDGLPLEGAGLLMDHEVTGRLR